MANLWPAGQTPYVTPGPALDQQPAGVDWTSIPASSTATQAQKTAALVGICMSATSQADGYGNTPLRGLVDTEEVSGPDYRVTIQQATGNVRIILSRWPVVNIASISVSPNIFPRQWQTVPAGNYGVEHPVISLYGTNVPSGAGGGGQSILLGGGYASWGSGRNGFVVKVTYNTGWPHTSLTAAASVNDTTLTVDDCTGWAPFTAGAPGASGIIYDGANQETVKVTSASVTAGPGTLTLSSPLLFTHTASAMVSAMPADIPWATALYAGADALTRGATATVLRASPGGAGGPTGADELRLAADLILAPFRRTI